MQRYGEKIVEEKTVMKSSHELSYNNVEILSFNLKSKNMDKV